MYLMRFTLDLCAQCEQSKNFAAGDVVTREDYASIIEKTRKRGMNLGMKKVMQQHCKVATNSNEPYRDSVNMYIEYIYTSDCTQTLYGTIENHSCGRGVI